MKLALLRRGVGLWRGRAVDEGDDIIALSILACVKDGLVFKLQVCLILCYSSQSFRRVALDPAALYWESTVTLQSLIHFSDQQALPQLTEAMLIVVHSPTLLNWDKMSALSATECNWHLRCNVKGEKAWKAQSLDPLP